jgi:hypothetical protein
MLLDIAHQLEVPLERDIRVVASLKQDLNASDCLALIDLGADLLEAEYIPFVVLGSPIEGAELTIGHTDVGVVDVPVYDVSDHVLRMLPPPLGISELPQLQERCPLIEIEVAAEFT